MRQLKNYDTKEKKQIKSTQNREKNQNKTFLKGTSLSKKDDDSSPQYEPTNHNEVNSQSDLLLLTNISIFNVDDSSKRNK